MDMGGKKGKEGYPRPHAGQQLREMPLDQHRTVFQAILSRLT